MRNHYGLAARLRRAEERGIAYPADELVACYQTNSGGKLHARVSCLRNTGCRDPRTVTMTAREFAATSDDKLCTHCHRDVEDSAGNPWTEWMRILDEAAGVGDADALDTQAQRQPLRSASKYRSQARHFTRLAEHTHPAVAATCQQAAERLRSAAERILAQQAKLNTGQIDRIVAAELMNQSRAFNKTDNWFQPERQYDTAAEIGAAWGRYIAQIRAGADTTTAELQAVRAAEERMQQRGPRYFVQVPDDTRFDAASFSHPFEWCNAEWRAAAADRIAEHAESWTAKLDEMCAGDDQVLVMRRAAMSSDTVFDSVIAPLTVHRLVAESEINLIVTVPAALLEAISRKVAPHHKKRVRRFDVTGDDARIAELAIALSEEGGEGELANICDAYEIAAAMVADTGTRT